MQLRTTVVDLSYLLFISPKPTTSHMLIIGMGVIPRSSSPKRLSKNLEAVDVNSKLHLSDIEMSLLSSIAHLVSSPVSVAVKY